MPSLINKRRIQITPVYVLSLLLLTVGSLVAQTAQPSAVPAYSDPSQPVDVRVDDLVSRMTLEEKASQLVNQARAIPRLQVPAYDWWSEALHGVAKAGTATVFPEPVGLAATFDAPLIHDMAVVIGTEARAKHNQAVRAGHSDIMEGLDFWSPNINIFRDPRWGRGQETYGEDPIPHRTNGGCVRHWTCRATIRNTSRSISTPKHFAVHSGPEPSRTHIDVQVSKHDMEDTYLPAFARLVTEGKAESSHVRLQPRQWPAAHAPINSCCRDQLRERMEVQWIRRIRLRCRRGHFSAATSSPRVWPRPLQFR